MSHSIQTIALVGATGRTGQHVLRQLLDAGHHVRALVRTPEKIVEHHERLVIIKGDATQLEAVVRLLDGSDAVLSTIGPVDGALRVCTQTTQHILSLLGSTRRYVVLGGAGTPMPTDRRRWFGRRVAQLMGVVGGAMQRDKLSEVEALLAAPVEAMWTLVRAPIITRGQHLKSLSGNTQTPGRALVNAASLAAFLIQQLNDAQFVRQGIFID